MNKNKYTVTIVSDEEEESFSISTCTCEECKLMHSTQVEWKSFIPKTNMQKRMLNIVSKIENDIKKKKRKKTS